MHRHPQAERIALRFAVEELYADPHRFRVLMSLMITLGEGVLPLLLTMASPQLATSAPGLL